MASRSTPLSGSASAVLSYYKKDEELGLDYGVDRVLEYHHVPASDSKTSDDLVFPVAYGKFAEELGFDKGITRAQFEDLWLGKVNGEQVVIPGRNKAVKLTDPDTGEKTATGEVQWVPRTSAIDVTISTPKSVSEALIKTKTDEERKAIIDEFAAGVRTFCEQGIEGDALLARVPSGSAPDDTLQQGSKTERVTADLAMFPVIEFIARPTEESVNRGSPPDPHLHAHVLVMSLCKVGDKYYTADDYGLKNRTNSVYRDSLANGEFTRRLEDLGYEIGYADWDRSRNGIQHWEIAGSDQKLRKFWSTNGDRAWRIRKDWEAEHNKPMPDHILNQMLSHTRKRKSLLDRQQDHAPVWARWAKDALVHGFKLKPFERKERKRNVDANLRELDRRLAGPNGLHQSESEFLRADIKPTIARCAVGLGFTPEELAGYQRILEHEIIKTRPATEPRFEYFTTRGLQQAELEIEHHLDVLQKKHRLVHLVGYAGTGKTTTIAAAVAALRNKPQAVKLDSEQTAASKRIIEMFPDGFDKIAFGAVSGSIAEHGASKLRADYYGSIESLCFQYDRGIFKPTARTLVILDETSQVDTLRMYELTKRLERHGSRIVLVGDPKQLVPIGAGGWWQDALERHDSVELTLVRRMRDQRDVVDAALVRNGNALQALKNMNERGKVVISRDEEERFGEVLNYYKGLRENGVRSNEIRMIFDSANVRVDEANRFVQRDLIERGEISPEGITVSAGRGEDVRKVTIHKRDQIIFTDSVNVGGQKPIRNGSYGYIKDIDLKNNVVKAVVYQPANDRGGRGESHLSRSQTQRPLEPREVQFQLKDGKAEFDIVPAYAQHERRFVGREVQYVAYAPGRDNAYAQDAYVNMSRQEVELKTFLDKKTHGDNPIEFAGQNMNRDGVKYSSLHQFRLSDMDDLSRDFKFSSASDRRAAMRYVDTLEQKVGPEIANRFVASPRFENTVERMRAMEGVGPTKLDVQAMMNDALDRDNLARYDDPNESIRDALDRESERAYKVKEPDRDQPKRSFWEAQRDKQFDERPPAERDYKF